MPSSQSSQLQTECSNTGAYATFHSNNSVCARMCVFVCVCVCVCVYMCYGYFLQLPKGMDKLLTSLLLDFSVLQ